MLFKRKYFWHQLICCNAFDSKLFESSVFSVMASKSACVGRNRYFEEQEGSILVVIHRIFFNVPSGE